MDKKELLEQLRNTRDFYAYFRNILQNIKIEDFFKIYDFETLDKFFKENCPYDEYKMYVSLIEKDINVFINSIKENKNILDSFISESDVFYGSFPEISKENFNVIMDEIKENEELQESKLEFASSVNLEILKDYINNDIDDYLLKKLVMSNQSLTRYFYSQDKRTIRLIEEGKLSIYPILNQKIKVNYDLLYSNVLFEKIKADNIVEFRKNVNNLLEANPSIVIETKVNKYEDDLIESYNYETGLFKEYEGINNDNIGRALYDKNREKLLFGNYELFNGEGSLDNKLKVESLRILRLLIVDRLFKDNYYNVIININEIIRYQKNDENIMISKDDLELYNKILKLDELTYEELMDIYNKYKNFNLNTKFYEDIRKYKEDSYQKIKEGLYKPTSINEQLSQTFNADVYLLDGQPFNMIIRKLNTNYREDTNLTRECFSLIGTDNTNRISDSGICYGYNNIDIKNIIHVSEVDAFSIDTIKDNKRVNRIMTSNEINSYAGLSEIQIKTTDKTLMPSYIVAFNSISVNEIEESKRLNIPVVLIDETKYNKKQLISQNIFDHSNDYVEDSNDEERYNRKR